MEGDPHIACSLLKLWLREMAEPLFPTDFTPEVRKKNKSRVAIIIAKYWVRVPTSSQYFSWQNLFWGSRFESRHHRIKVLLKKLISNFQLLDASEDKDKCIELVKNLPELNRRSLLHLLRFLQVFARPPVPSKTRMDAANLAMVMAPNLFR